MDTGEDFRTMFCKLVEQYQLSPQVAAELLRKILTILQKGAK